MIEVARATSVAVLARWANILNSWEWPTDFPVEKPVEFDSLPSRNTSLPADKYRLLTPYVRVIESLISRREILRDWHLNTLGRTEEQFDEWWSSRRAPPDARD